MNRRSLFAALLLACALPLAAQADTPLAQTRFGTLDGKGSTTLSAWRGKVVLVNFWATWCAPCREEMPMLNKLREQYKGKGLEVVGIALDNRTEASNFAKQLRIGYPVVIGDSDTLGLLRQLGNPAGALPYSIILDRNGQQVGKLLGKLDEKTLSDTLQRYF
ncbi:TlpA disulfide reductase family protein [uncultured Aquitalea sp.]|nr:TlpA disulfide reductase family protein [uncultured Aquitalea sp.]